MIKNQYNRLAPYYDFLAQLVFGKSLLHARRYFLDLLPKKAKILLIGGGTGQILPVILKDNRQIHVVYLEKSHKMIALAKKRLDKRKAGQVRFIEGDESNLPEGGKYDAVITNFFLDQFREERLRALTGLLYNCLNTSGLWLFTDFQVKKGQVHYCWQSSLIKLMYLFFKLTTNVEVNKLPEFQRLFGNQNLDLIREKHFLKKLIVSRVYKK